MSRRVDVFRVLFFCLFIVLVGGLFLLKTAPAQAVTAAQVCQADINQDGTVNLSDYSIFIKNFLVSPVVALRADINGDGTVNISDYTLLVGSFLQQCAVAPTATPVTSGGAPGDSMAMQAWSVGGKNAPNPKYDKCDDGTDVVKAHNSYYVVAYDGMKYPTWHPPVVTNPITGVGKCYFGHEHGTNPQGYQYWDEIVQHFGKDVNGDGKITAMVIGTDGKITPGDHAGIPFGIANEHMNEYYNQEGRDSIFVRHEDHVGHKIEYVNGEADMVGNTTHVMQPINTTGGINVPYYKGTDSNTYYPTGVKCTHFHKFHQGTHSGDAMRNNLHEVIFHSNCTSDRPEYPSNEVILTGMMSFGNPGEYKRFCGNDRSTVVCVDGKDSSGKCIITDPLISKLPGSIYSNTLGRNMIDRYCLQNVDSITGSFYFNPYEIWQGDFRISTPNGKLLAEHGRQWDVLDPIRFVDPNSATGFGYNSQECGPGGLLYKRTLNCGALESKSVPWDSPQSGFRGLKRTTYFGRNRVSNAGGSQTWWTDPLGGNATTTQFASGLKQHFSSVEADICKLTECSKLNDRAIQRQFNDGGGTVHAPN
ncbi:MAG: dockerin type I repeat-containing protein [Candidatus Woesebacteria bacterium]